MNDEYLWNGTGSDREIETLEEKLKVFRYQPDAPPQLPAAFAETPAKPRHRWMSWLAPSFAAVAVAIVAGSLFLRSGGRETPLTVNSETPANFQAVPGTVPAVEKGKTTRSETEINSSRASLPEIKRAELPSSRTKSFRVVRTAARTASGTKRQNSSQPVLTSEERYAYNQLMLALSITGEKLKMVKDSINGTGEYTVPDAR